MNKFKRFFNRVRKMPLWAKIVSICLFTLICVACISYGIIHSKLNKINRVKANSTVSPSDEYFDNDLNSLSGDPSIASLPSATPSPNDYVNTSTYPEDKNSKYEALYDKNITNIILIGQDRRPNEKRARSDSMVLLTIDNKCDDLKMTSFLRDMYVEIPGYSNNKLNSAFAFGSTPLMYKTFRRNFGINIDGCLIVDFPNFVKIIDKLDGVDIKINSKEADYLKNKGFKVSKGDVHMNGELALCYARIRKIDSDFSRTSRQRTILSAIFNKLSKQSLSTLLEISDKILPLLTTDMENDDILINLKKIALKKSIKDHKVPEDNTYQDTYVGSMSVLLPDLDKNYKLLKKRLYKKE